MSELSRTAALSLSSHHLVWNLAELFFAAGSSAIASLRERGELDNRTAELIELERRHTFELERERILSELLAHHASSPIR